MTVLQNIKFGDCFKIKHGFAFKGEYFSDNGDYIVTTPGNFYDQGGFKPKNGKEKFYIGPIPKEFVLNEFDLIVAMTEQMQGLLGSSALIPENNKYLHNQRIGLIHDIDEGKIDKHFLYYIFNTPKVREQIQATANGAKVRHTSPSRIYEITVSIPGVQSQRRIASILSAYDDLIENNTRRIAILEEMARRLYEEWFVNFRFPGYGTARFVETELGLVPEGWEVCKLNSLYQSGSGGTPSRKHEEYYGDEHCWVKTKELSDGPIFSTEEKISSLGLKNSSAKLFPPYTILIAMYGATIGKLGILKTDAATNQACCALLPSTSEHGWGYLFLSLQHNRERLIDLRAGAAQQNISQEKIRNFLILKATSNIHLSFEKAICPYMELVFNLHSRNANLRAQRDLLLPKLISGELDVSEAEEAVEEVAV